MTVKDYIPTSGKEARAIGAMYYFSGSTCVRGHVANRYAVNGACSECILANSQARAKKALTDPELAEKMRKWHRDSKRKARDTSEGKKAHYEANKRYINANRDKVNAYYRDAAKINPLVKVKRAARSMLNKVLVRANVRKDAKCVDMLGYTGEMLKAHLERQFTKGMKWELFGVMIHIDHIIPVAELLRRGVNDPRIINALTNLRPMWAEDNITKRDKVLTLL